MRNSCTVAGCSLVSFGHGFCQMHYARWKKSGDPGPAGKLSDRSPSVRFAAKTVRDENGCVVWIGGLGSGGYGKFYVDGAMVLAHRWAWENAHGRPVPKGLDLDHLCRNRACVNPDHLEPVTRRVNTLRGVGPTAINAEKAECPSGHPYSGSNLYVNPYGGRECRACSRESARRHRARKASA